MTALTVLIPTHGRPVLLEKTLASLAACVLPEGYRETVVVENGSRAGAEQVLAEVNAAQPVLRLRYLHVERANKSHALNEALATVGEGLIVFFDDDIRVEPETLVAYARVAQDHQRAFFGGAVACDYEQEPPEWLLEYLPWSAKGFSLDGPRPEWFLGANWAVKICDLRQVGVFNVDVGPGSVSGARGQETEMQRRMRRAGFTMVDVPDALVWHHVPADRCTPRWAVDRMYRSGLGFGTRARRGGAPRMFRKGVREVLVQGKELVISTCLGRQPERVASQVTLAFWRGYFHAYLVSGRCL